MEETRKRHSGGGGVAETPTVVATKWQRKVAITEAADDLEEDKVAWLSMEDDTVAELMKFLETDSKQATAARVRFTDNPYSSPLLFQCSSSYVTINGNEESCGSSFSDCESSVMASVDMGGIGIARNAAGGFHGLNAPGAWSSSEGVSGRGRMQEEDGGNRFLIEGWLLDGDGGDHAVVGWEWDEECVVKFLGEDFFDH